MTNHVDDTEDMREELKRERYQHSPTTKDVFRILDREIFNGECPLVISLDGRWGEGKTYFWKNVIVPKYESKQTLYVSVFGASTIQEIRERVIFESLRNQNWIQNKQIKKSVDSGRSIVSRIPYVGEIFRGTLDSIHKRWPELVNTFLIPKGLSIQIFEEQILNPGLIICLDDIERTSESIKIDHLLGYINELKEERKLKIVLIYNHERLGKHTENFKKLQEKVIDKRIVFSPNIKEILGIVFDRQGGLKLEDGLMEELARRCNLLGLRNIRLLQRLKRYSEECMNAISNPKDEHFLREVICSLLLFIWTKYCSDDAGAITLDFLSELSSFYLGFSEGSEDRDPMTEQKKFLREYGYAYTSELDLILMQLIDSDVLNMPRLQKEYDKFAKDISGKQMTNKFREVWKKYYHGTLRNNEAEFCDALVNITKQYIELVPINNLDSVLYKLETLGRKKDADILLDEFKNKRNKSLEAFDRRDLFEPIKHEGLEKYLNDLEKIIQKDERNIGEVIDSALRSEFPSPQDRKKLSELSVNDYVAYFTSEDHEDVTLIMRDLANFAKKITNPDEYELKLRDTIIQAASQIATTSRINRERMKSMGLIQEE